MQKSKRPRVLLLSDSIRGKSGVGVMANQIVLNTAADFNWFHIAPELNTGGKTEKFDLSADVARLSGVPDAEVSIVPYHSFGDMGLLRTILHREQIDAILIFTDPRYWEWLFENEREIRQLVPIIFYNIWDNYPAPHYNKAYYQSVDALIAISKLTQRINRQVLGDPTHGIPYVPHGVDHATFKPVIGIPYMPDDKACLDLRKKLVGDAEFVVLYNSRNIDRKNPLDVIHAFSMFMDGCRSNMEDVDTIKLIMHTDVADPAGVNLMDYIDDHVPAYVKRNIIFSTEKLDNRHMNYLYNIANVTISLSSNEGWGLSITESLMAATPVIATHTGGMIDQMMKPNSGGHGEWATSIYPVAKNLIGSHQTPYIYADRIDIDDAVTALIDNYYNRSTYKERGLSGRMHLIENKMTSIDMAQGIAKVINDTIENSEHRTDFDIIRI